MTPAGTSNELDVQNGWEENTHTYLTLKQINGNNEFVNFAGSQVSCKNSLQSTRKYVLYPNFTLSYDKNDLYRAYACVYRSIPLFLTFSVLVANPKKLLYTVANPARGLLNREKRTKEKSLAAMYGHHIYCSNRVKLPILLVAS